MKTRFRFTCFAFVLATAPLLTGCLFNSSIAPVRYFVLAPLSTNEQPTTKGGIPVAIGPVKMPPHLLRTAVMVRHGTNEIEYLEGARWGERLDECLQRTLVANLSRLLPSDHVCSVDSAGGRAMTRVFVDVQQFEVETEGRGTLIAHWRIQPANSDASPSSGITRLERTGNPPHGNALAIAATLSDLTAEFSRGLAESVRESAKATN